MSLSIYRTDLLAHATNPGKEEELLAVVRAWRQCAVRVAGEQWRLFFQEGGFNKLYRNPDEDALAQIAGAANRVQMVRYKVVETLESFVSNRQRGFRKKVHADVNAPRNLRARRTRTFRASNGANAGRGYVTKACVLRTLVHDFMRQCAEIEKVGRRGTSRDPRPTNPYFKQFVGEELALVISSGVEHAAHTPCASKP